MKMTVQVYKDGLHYVAKCLHEPSLADRGRTPDEAAARLKGRIESLCTSLHATGPLDLDIQFSEGH